jgi:hypothetical protein
MGIFEGESGLPILPARHRLPTGKSCGAQDAWIAFPRIKVIFSTPLTQPRQALPGAIPPLPDTEDELRGIAAEFEFFNLPVPWQVWCKDVSPQARFIATPFSSVWQLSLTTAEAGGAGSLMYTGMCAGRREAEPSYLAQQASRVRPVAHIQGGKRPVSPHGIQSPCPKWYAPAARFSLIAIWIAVGWLSR